MPVADHPIHPSVIKTDIRAGCHNRKPFSAGYYAQDRHYFPNGQWAMMLVFVPHVLSTGCRQTLDLPECEGCTAEKDAEYFGACK